MRCDRSLPDEDVGRKSEDLKNLFGIDSLDKGICPVCGGDLMERRPDDQN